TNRARLDDKTGELVFDDLQIGTLQLTRRVLVDKEANHVRYIDILKNRQPQEQTVTVQITSNINYGINSATEATGALRASWPIVELHPQRRHGQLAGKLAQRCACYEVTLSRNAGEFVQAVVEMMSQPVRRGAAVA
ncbi:MAG TPA: hypothetical protein VF669_10915, partial [Tepidisphaeraceae bacterium]